MTTTYRKESATVEQPPSQTNVLKALLAARQEFDPVIKNETNPHYKNRYADLRSVLGSVTPALAKHGLLLIQRTRPDESGLVLVTEVVHAATGERLDSIYPLTPARPNDPQALASALTYARRYSTLTLLGIAPEDDDGQEASRPPKRRERPAIAEPGSGPAPGGPPPAQEDEIDRWYRKLESCQSVAALKAIWVQVPAHLQADLAHAKDGLKANLQSKENDRAR